MAFSPPWPVATLTRFVLHFLRPNSELNHHLAAL
jgi:hypothetical protein